MEKIQTSSAESLDGGEKGVVRHVTGTSTPEEVEAAPHFTPAQTKKLLWKMDWNLVPFLALLYL